MISDNIVPARNRKMVIKRWLVKTGTTELEPERACPDIYRSRVSFRCSQLRTLAPIVTAHRYCARKFTRHVMHRARSQRNKTSNNQRLGSAFDPVTVIPWRNSLADFHLLSLAKINISKKIRSWRVTGMYNTVTKSKAVFPCGFLFGK